MGSGVMVAVSNTGAACGRRDAARRSKTWRETLVRGGGGGGAATTDLGLVMICQSVARRRAGIRMDSLECWSPE